MRLKTLSSFILLALVACGPVTPIPEVDTSPTPVSSTLSSPLASAKPTPKATPSASPTVISSVAPTPTTVPAPSTSPSIVASPLPGQDLTIGTVKGTVFNLSNIPVNKAIVTLRSLDGDVAYEKSVTTSSDGTYEFTDAPLKRLEVRAGREGYAFRQREIMPTEALKAFVFDFSAFEENGVALDLRLSQAPEVVSINFESPNGLPVDFSKTDGKVPHDAVIVVKFSEPMQQNIVNSSLLIEEVTDAENPEKYFSFDFNMEWNLALDTKKIRIKSDPDWLKRDARYRLSYMGGNHIISDLGGTPRTADHFKLGPEGFTSSFEFERLGR